MLKKGDKVVPLRKTLHCSLGSSMEWNRARKMGQCFLYVANISDDGEVGCSAYKQNTGDIFHVSDLITYEEFLKNAPSPEINGIKLNCLKGKDLLNLFESGILKEEDDIIFGRK